MSAVPLEIYRLDLATGKRSPWIKLAPPDMTGVDPYYPFNNVMFAADGKAYAFGYWAGTSDLYLVEGLAPPVAPAYAP